VDRTIAIVGGTGPEGTGLALRFARAGARVRIGSRSLERAQATAQKVKESAGGGQVEGFLNVDAVSGSDVVVLTVPPEAQIDTLESIRAHFRQDAILVDATVRLKAADSSAMIAAAHVPAGVAVASAFHTLGHELLAHLEESIDSDVMVCADDGRAKEIAAGMVRLLPGARPVDAGGLKNSRLIENLVQLLIALNRRHKVKHAGVRITGL